MALSLLGSLAACSASYANIAYADALYIDDSAAASPVQLADASTTYSGFVPGQDAKETVIVSATRRPEPLQKVPVAVTVVDGNLAAFQNLNNINAIATAVPSLNFRDGSSNKDQGLFIRGVGTVTTSPGAEPSVSTVVDGVVLVRPGQATFDLSDVDHIEVLRGPQGTLFGKNASAGVVNILTKNPTADFTAGATVSYYERNELRANASVSGALLPGKLNALASLSIGNFDGNVTNVYNDHTVNGYRKYGGRVKLEFTPDDALRILLAADYLYTNSTGTATFAGTNISYPGGVVTKNPSYVALIAPVVASDDNRRINSNPPTYVIDNNAGVSAQIDWSLSDYTLTSVSAYRKWHNHQVGDNDITSASAYIKQIVDYGWLDFDQYSEEVRIASPKGALIEYVAGGYYLHAVDTETYERQDTAAGTGKVNTGIAHYGTKNDNYSLFAEVTANLTQSFRAIAGVRLIGDDLGYHHQRQSTAADSGINVSSAYHHDETIKYGYASHFGLQYDISHDVSGYVSYAHGYKGPAYNVFFNMLPATQGKVLDPETSDSFELGLKSKLFDNRLLVNLAAFHTEFHDFQANFPNLINGTVVTNLVNAGTVLSQGVEADFSASPLERLTLSGGLAYTNAYVDKTAIVGRNWAIAGQPLPFTPAWKFSLRADYRYPLSNSFDLDFGTDTRWQSKVQYDLSESPDTIENSFGIWNADISLENHVSDWSVSFTVKNLLNHHYASYLQSTGATAASGSAGYVTRWVPRDDSRYVGINLHKDF
ncbi:MAG: TonB-dependent receptor [Rhizomicrobium sp.]